MRYLTLAEALTIAEAVTGIDAAVLAPVSRVDMLDSALHAPQAGSVTRSSIRSSSTRPLCWPSGLRNHPLPDGNKRLARQALTMFCVLNVYDLHVPPDDAVGTMVAIAAGELDEVAVADWLAERVTPLVA